MTLAELKKQIAKLNNGVDGVNDELLKAIEEYQQRYELELRRINFDTVDGELKSTASNYTKVQKLDMVQELNFKGIVKDNANNYNTVVEVTEGFHKSLGIDTDKFKYKDLSILKVIKNQDSISLLTEGLQLDNLVKKELINAVALNQPLSQTIANLSDNLLGSGEKMGKLARYSKTYMNTSIQGLSRMVDKKIMDELDLKDEYLYAGTVDLKIRPFCKAHVGKTYTKKEIEKFPVENNSGLDPFFAPGGWSCRHRMISTDLV